MLLDAFLLKCTSLRDQVKLGSELVLLIGI